MQPHLQQVFSALGDPTRFAIVESLLKKQEQTVGELAEPHKMSAPAISRHIKVLEEAGIVEREINKQWRVCRLRRECFSSVDEWFRQYRDFWTDSLDRMEVFLEQDQKGAE